MKLRIRGNSLRLRVSRPEMARLLRDARIEETIRFAPQSDAKLVYALEHARADEDISLRYQAGSITIVLSTEAAARWAESNDVGVYGDADTGDGPLALLVEKDFACLDGDDPHDAEAFPNPNVSSVC